MIAPGSEPVVVDFPLRGEWTVERTPAHRVPSHGTDLFGQRYAYDFVRTDDRAGYHVHPAGSLRWLLVGGRARDCYGWGQPVHAALGGEVVGAVDGVPERRWIHVVRESWLALRNARAYGTGRRPLDARRVAGNHLVIRTGGVHALYAHLAPGSVAVATGQHVAAGEVIGRVGHTGNSTAPHLHFHLMDAADPLRARGVPCAFARYLVRRDGRWETVADGVPQRRERVRSTG
ncbi:MAG TPA: M23 family metallopeptidase [Acidimicrobiales bacterium]